MTPCLDGEDGWEVVQFYQLFGPVLEGAVQLLHLNVPLEALALWPRHRIAAVAFALVAFCLSLVAVLLLGIQDFSPSLIKGILFGLYFLPLFIQALCDGN